MPERIPENELFYSIFRNCENAYYERAVLVTRILKYGVYDMIRFLNYLFGAEQYSNCYLWVVPHLYIVVNQLLVPAFITRSNFLSECFIDNFHKFPISQLTITMHTTKQIHDFKIEREWKEFCHFCYLKEKTPTKISVLDTVFFDKSTLVVFKSVFYNSLGHSLSGPAVGCQFLAGDHSIITSCCMV